MYISFGAAAISDKNTFVRFELCNIITLLHCHKLHKCPKTKVQDNSGGVREEITGKITPKHASSTIFGVNGSKYNPSTCINMHVFNGRGDKFLQESNYHSPLVSTR